MMEDKIEVGEYVRNKEGKIIKVTWVGQAIVTNDKYTMSKLSGEITKHSKNIIDLIEVGDIVHTRDVLSDDIYYMWDEEMVQTTKKFIQKGIKFVDILTKEQYKANVYNFGGVNE